MIKITELAHKIIIENGRIDLAVDMTIGRGNDTLILASIAKKVFGFDIQDEALEITRNLLEENNFHNFQLIKDNHENILKHINDSIDLAIYNLGYLPQGNKEIKTEESSTINSLKALINIFNSSGLILIVLYPHNYEEIDAVESFVRTLDINYDVLQYKVMNRNNSPFIITIKKR